MKCASGKTGSYPDFETAIAAALRCSVNLGPLRCYECPECGQWHLTRRKQWVER
ncbi:hypothetical protein [Nocardioides sp. InS609-2]|uniref:hypothetical protein n=1 Tax=Nocardioides sp. InS609-2 TaxID=2760705 RepID=UPI0020BDD644|nr:hypothetical protein [Nocardioides sp. InS609-2]